MRLSEVAGLSSVSRSALRGSSDLSGMCYGSCVCVCVVLSVRVVGWCMLLVFPFVFSKTESGVGKVVVEFVQGEVQGILLVL